MQELGKRMRDHCVRDMLFVHGTFRGYDPLGIFFDNSDAVLTHAVDQLAGLLLPGGLQGLQAAIKRGIDRRAGDLANFLPSYVRSCAVQLGHDVCRTPLPFCWSGANLHSARLEATVRLAASLARSIDTHAIQADERILVIGHSHAGQLFALLTQLLHNAEPAEALLQELQPATRSALVKYLETVHSVYLDFVTYGTPVRYRWARYPRFRLLPMINHRSNSRLDLKAIYDVADGDYVQQWGTEGTDLPSGAALEQRLSELLHDAGFDIARIATNLLQGLAGQPQPRKEPEYSDGEAVTANVLVDYEDQRPAGNTDPLYCGRVLLGHGVYTRMERLQFNTRLIADAFYP